MNILDGKKIKEDALLKIKDRVTEGANLGIDVPTLAVIQVGDLEESNSYIKNKRNSAERVGINMEIFKLPEEASFEQLSELINILNVDESVNGIFIQLPIPVDKLHQRVNELIELIKPLKDVDGLTSVNMGKLLKKEPGLYPCTAVGIMGMLDYYKIDLIGRNVVVVGRGNLVGRPLFEMLINRDATVTLCHSKTLDLKKYTQAADVVISAVGKPGLITANMIRDGAVVIDAGTIFQDGKLVGDVCFDEVSKKTSAISKVPGGVGQTTVLSLLQNTLEAQSLQRAANHKHFQKKYIQ